MRLVAKNKLKKMIKFSSSFKLNEIHIVDSPFNEDLKNINFFHGGPNLEEGRPENLEKCAITGTSIVMRIRGWSISKENISLYTLVPKSL